MQVNVAPDFVPTRQFLKLAPPSASQVTVVPSVYRVKADAQDVKTSALLQQVQVAKLVFAHTIYSVAIRVSV